MPNEIVITGDEPCPKCRENGRDVTGNHLILFSNGNKYCNRCEYKEFPKSSKNEDLTPSQSKGKMDVETIKSLPSAELKDRGLTKDTCQRYGIKVQFSEETGEVVSHYYPRYQGDKLFNYKKRDIPKQMYLVNSEGKGSKLNWFGQHLFQQGGKRLIITGGELDAPSAYQMLMNKYPSMHVAVVAPPNGENIGSLSDEAITYANSFDEIISCADMDKAGDKFTRKLADLFYGKLSVAKFSENDCNDMLVAGKEEEFCSAIFNASRFKPKALITVSDVYEDAIKVPEYGKPFPWQSLTELTYGRRPGDGYYIGAGTKIGKSEMLNQMVSYIINKEQTKPFIAKPEEQPGLTVKKIAGKIFHKNFHDPHAFDSGLFTQAELIEAVDAIEDKLLMYNRYGNMDWDELSSCIRHAVVVEGTTDVFIDPITCFTDGMDASEADKLLKRITRELDSMAKDLGFTFYCFCHLNNPPTGKSWEEGREPRSFAFANSRGMMRACQYMIGIARDKYAEDEEVKNTSKFILLDDRNFGNFGKFDVYYDRETGDYLER